MSSTYAPPRKGYAYRDNERVLISDPRFANELWECLLKSLLRDSLIVDGKTPVGLNDDLRIYRHELLTSEGCDIL